MSAGVSRSVTGVAKNDAARKTLRAQVRNPLDTNRRIELRAATSRELETRKDYVDRLRRDLLCGMKSEPEVRRELARMARGVAATVDELFARYVETLTNPHTRRKAMEAWRLRIAPRFGGKRWYTVDERGLAEFWAKAAATGLAGSTIENTCGFLQASIRRAYDERVIDEIPWRGWKTPKYAEGARRESCRSLEEAERIVAAAVAEDARRWHRGKYADMAVRVYYLLLAGNRQAEAAAQSWDHVHIDREDPYEVVEFQALSSWKRRWPDRPRDPRKAGKVDMKAIHPKLAAALREHRARLIQCERYAPDGPLFPNGAGGYRRDRVIEAEHAFRRIIIASGLSETGEGWCVHSLRHTFCTLEAFGSGGDLRAVQERTGHSSITELSSYLHSRTRGMARSCIGDVQVNVSPPAHVAFEPRVPKPTPSKRAMFVKPNLAELARAWVAKGNTAGRPDAVAHSARLAYSRTYQRQIAKGTTAEQAAKSGAESKKGVLGAWGRALRAAIEDATPAPASASATGAA